MRKLLAVMPRERRRDFEKRALWARQQEIEKRIRLIEAEIAELKR